jgi:hypothetical protein
MALRTGPPIKNTATAFAFVQTNKERPPRWENTTGSLGLLGASGEAKRTAAGRDMPSAANTNLSRRHDSLSTQARAALKTASALETEASRPLQACLASEIRVRYFRTKSVLFWPLPEKHRVKFRPAFLACSLYASLVALRDDSSTPGTAKGRDNEITFL